MSSQSRYLKDPYFQILFFLLLCRLIAMYCIPLNDSTEARYAEIARKMLETKDWVTLWHDYGIPFWAKPPLSTWLSALSMKLFVVNEFAVRLPSLLLSISTLALLSNFIRKHLDIDVAKLTLLILTSSLFFFIDAGAVMTDPSLLFCTTLALVSFWEAFVLQNKAWGYVFFASIGLGLLAKGPLIIVLTGLPIISFALIYKQFARLWANLPWFSGIGLTAIIALPWYLLAEYRSPGFLNYFIVGEHFGRFLIAGWSGDKYGFAHNQPLGMIWLYFFLGFLPWSFAALYLVLNAKNKWLVKPWAFIPNNTLLGYLLLWILTPLIFFSFSRNIIYTYCFTALPAAALLLACFSIVFNAFKRLENLFFLLTLATGLLSLVITAASLIFPEKVNNTQKSLINTWIQENNKTKNKIMYYSNSKSYSAEFYAKGQVGYLNTLLELKQFINLPEIHYLVINQSDKHTSLGHLVDNLHTIYSNKSKILLSTKIE